MCVRVLACIQCITEGGREGEVRERNRGREMEGEREERREEVVMDGY